MERMQILTLKRENIVCLFQVPTWFRAYWSGIMLWYRR